MPDLARGRSVTTRNPYFCIVARTAKGARLTFLFLKSDRKTFQTTGARRLRKFTLTPPVIPQP